MSLSALVLAHLGVVVIFSSMEGCSGDGQGLRSSQVGEGFSVQASSRGEKLPVGHDAVDETLKQDLGNGMCALNGLRGGLGLEEVCREGMVGEGQCQDQKRRRVAGVEEGVEVEVVAGVADEGIQIKAGKAVGRSMELSKGGEGREGVKSNMGGGYLLRKRRAESCAELYLRLKEQGTDEKQRLSPEKRVEKRMEKRMERGVEKGLLGQSVQTRAMAKRSIDWLGMLPDEMWAEVLSHLPYTDIGKAMCVCKSFSSMEPYVWRLACANQWPELTARMATVPDRMFKTQKSRWRKCYEMLSLRAAENALVAGWGDTFADKSGAGLSVGSVESTSSLQKDVTPRYRSVLVEWMIEVAQEWKLDSTMIFQATRYLDFYLRSKEVDIGKFQLVGVSAIRLAVSYPRPQMKIKPAHHACLMDPARYAHVCDGAATEEGVVAMTEELDGMVSKSMREAPNAKMYLRCLWYTISKTGISGCTSEDMHIYVLAAFLLELGQTDLAFSTFSHSSLAGASMSLALEFYGKEPWPVSLLAFSSYTSKCLAEQRKVLARAQAVALASNVRDIWGRFYQNHLYHESRSEWDRLLAVIGHRGADFVEVAFGADVSLRLAACMGEMVAQREETSTRGQGDVEMAMLRVLQ